jgi:hypothetical protein
MEWIGQGLVLLILGWVAEAAGGRLCAVITPLVFDFEPLPPIFSLNRRIRPNLSSYRRRASDNICPWPRLLA